MSSVEKVEVPSDALYRLLRALGDPDQTGLREIIATRRVSALHKEDNNPINVLVNCFNKHVEAHRTEDK